MSFGLTTGEVLIEFVEVDGEGLIEFVEVDVFRDFVAFLHIILHQHEATLVGLKLSKSNFCVNFLAQ
jgi:hypothetical protein